MPFDDYVTKPVSREELFDTIERLLTFRSYEEQFQEFYRLTTKLATLRANKNEAELQRNDSFQGLQDRRDELKGSLDDTLSSFDDDDFSTVFQEFDTEE